MYESHISKEKAREQYLNSIFAEIKECANTTFDCVHCEFSNPLQMNQLCIVKLTLNKFLMNPDSVLFKYYMYKIANKVVACAILSQLLQTTCLHSKYSIPV